MLFLEANIFCYFLQNFGKQTETEMVKNRQKNKKNGTETEFLDGPVFDIPTGLELDQLHIH